MVIEQRHVGTAVVLDLNGSLSAGDGQIVLRETVRQLIMHGQARVVLNMERLKDLDSMGLGALIGVYGTIVNAGGRIALINMPRRVANVMSITRLLTVFDAFESEPDAVRHVAPSSPLANA
jgi:anti-sigma B factor antagonist